MLCREVLIVNVCGSIIKLSACESMFGSYIGFIVALNATVRFYFLEECRESFSGSCEEQIFNG